MINILFETIKDLFCNLSENEQLREYNEGVERLK